MITFWLIIFCALATFSGVEFFVHIGQGQGGLLPFDAASCVLAVLCAVRERREP